MKFVFKCFLEGHKFKKYAISTIKEEHVINHQIRERKVQVYRCTRCGQLDEIDVKIQFLESDIKGE